MRFNHFFFLALLFFTILGIQSFSNCNPTPPPDPGLIDIQIATVDTANQPLPHTLVGLFAASELRDSRFAPSFFGCLIDTFYTDEAGYKKTSYVSEKYNYYWVAVLPNNHSAPYAKVIHHTLDTAFTVRPILPLLSVNIKKSYYDSVVVQTLDLPKTYCNKKATNNLSGIPLTLNREKTTTDAQFLFNAVPNRRAGIHVLNYSKGKIVKDSSIIVPLGETIREVQIN